MGSDGEGLRAPSIFLKVFELILGIICFGLEVNYNFGYKVIREDSFYSTMYDDDAIVTAGRLIYATTVAYPFFILPLYIVAMLANGKEFTASLFNPLMCVMAFVLYLATGSYVIDKFKHLTDESEAFGAMCIVTGVAYLVDFLLEILYRVTGRL